mgnify:CR=1 FL=1
MDKPQTTDRLWTLPYILLILMGTFTSTAFYMVNPSMAKFSISLGATVTLAGVITGMFSITALVARPVSGLIADRVNRKLLLIISVCIRDWLPLATRLPAPSPCWSPCGLSTGSLFPSTAPSTLQ